MLNKELILKKVNQTILEKPILDARINSVQLETLASVLIDEINYHFVDFDLRLKALE